MSFWDNFDKNKKQLIAAHRGFRSVRAENTMAAFKEAIGKCDYIELDVGFSKDGVAIIIHDDTLERTSNCKNISGFNPPYNIIDYTYEELLKLDFSSWFMEKDPLKTIKNGVVTKEFLKSLAIERIPTLKEVLNFLRENNVPINVEIKDLKESPYHDTVLKNVIDIIKDAKMEKLTLLSSYNHDYIREAYLYAPDLTRAILVEDENPKDLVEYLNEVPTKDYNINFDILNKEMIYLLTNAGIRINVFTVNQKKDKEMLFKYGMNSIFTDFL